MTAKRLSYYLLGGGGLGAVVLVLVFLWLWSAVHAASDRALLADASADQIQARLTSLEHLDATYHKLQPALTKLEAALPESATPEVVIAMLKAQTAAAGMTMTTIDFKSTAPVTPTAGAAPVAPKVPAVVTAPGISYTIHVAGSYGALRNLLARLDTATPLTDVNSWNLSKGQKEADSLDATLQMTSYDQR